MEQSLPNDDEMLLQVEVPDWAFSFFCFAEDLTRLCSLL